MLKDGVINIDKPAGWTSHDVVAKVKSLIKVKRVGHTGTLDPLATGVLPICFGKGTKVASFLMGAEKEYDARLRLGQETETQDRTGKVIRSCDLPEGLSASVPSVVESFVGDYHQTPPMYSAIKVSGVPLYKAARAGKVIERAPRTVTIKKIDIQRIEGNEVSFSVVCSKGTYIRTLCSDIGERLGVGAHLVSLCRIRSGLFRLADAISIDHFCDLYRKGRWEEEAYALNEALSGFPALRVREGYLQKIKHGAAVSMDGIDKYDIFKRGEVIRFLSPDGVLLAIATALTDFGNINLQNRERRFYKMEAVLCETEQ